METSIEVRYCLIFDQKSTKKFAFANLGIFEKNLNLLCIKNSDIKLAPNFRPKRNSIEAKIPAPPAPRFVHLCLLRGRGGHASTHAQLPLHLSEFHCHARTLWLQSSQSSCHESSLYF